MIQLSFTSKIMNVLVVEDEYQVALSIKKSLSRSSLLNFIDIAHDFDTAFNKYFSGVFDIVLLDIYLGRESLSGLDLCRKIRESDSSTPIIIITSFHAIQYLERAFELGANDYIGKPFHGREVMLRVEQWLTLYDKKMVREKLKYKGFIYDSKTNQFYFNRNHINLTKKNKILFKLFIERPEELLSEAYIREKFWGDYPFINKNRNLRSNIQSLRTSLRPYCSNCIRTSRGEGYILKI